MDVLTKLAADIGSLWQQYHGMYLRGMLNTLLLALAATAVLDVLSGFFAAY